MRAYQLHRSLAAVALMTAFVQPPAAAEPAQPRFLALRQSVDEVREQMRTGKPPSPPAGGQNAPTQKGELLRANGIALAVAGMLVTAIGVTIAVASAEGHSPLGRCSDCGPAGEALGVVIAIGGAPIGATGGILWSLGGRQGQPPTQPAPQTLTLKWTFRF